METQTTFETESIYKRTGTQLSPIPLCLQLYVTSCSYSVAECTMTGECTCTTLNAEIVQEYYYYYQWNLNWVSVVVYDQIMAFVHITCTNRLTSLTYCSQEEMWSSLHIDSLVQSCLSWILTSAAEKEQRWEECGICLYKISTLLCFSQLIKKKKHIYILRHNINWT